MTFERTKFAFWTFLGWDQRDLWTLLQLFKFSKSSIFISEQIFSSGYILLQPLLLLDVIAVFDYTEMPRVPNFAPVKCLKEACSRDHFPILIHFPRSLIGPMSFCQRITGAKLGNGHMSSLFQTVYWSKIWYPECINVCIHEQSFKLSKVHSWPSLMQL